MNIQRNHLESFQSSGYIKLKSFFSRPGITSFEESLIDVILLQVSKISCCQALINSKNFSDFSPYEKFISIFEMLEQEHKEALYQSQKMLKSYMPLLKIFDDRFFETCGTFLNCSPKDLLLDGPHLFVNRPNTKRLLYRWHSEAHYYPKRRSFLNIWFPIYINKSDNNGTMHFKEGSHNFNFPFNEYQGYDSESHGKKNHFIQYEIPSNFLENFPVHKCISSPQDLYIFHSNLVHASTINQSESYSVAVVARVWNPKNDLTLSGEITAYPYGGNFSEPDLRVESSI